MDLQAVRKKLVELSGLYSLVTDFPGADYSDNGADFFIQTGQRYLESLLETPQEFAEFSTTLAQGEYTKTVSQARAIKRVRIESSDGIKYLTKKGLKELREDWGSEDTLDNVDQDEPTDYTIGITRDLSGDADTEKDKKLIIMPPADASYTLFIEGKFYSEKLVADDDSNWWSVQFPDLLIQAALFKREVFMRNTQGVNDWRNALIDAVNHIDMDNVEESIAEIDQMKDSWNFRDGMPRRQYG